MRSRILRLFSLALLASSLLAAPFQAAAQTSDTYFIFKVDSTKFPDVTFQLRAVDVNDRPKVGLNPDSLSVFENGEPVPNAAVTPKDGPINYVFVIDQGRLSNSGYSLFGVDKLKLGFATLVNGGFFKDGVDSVTVLARQNVSSDQTVTLLPTAHTGAEFLNFISIFSFNLRNGQTTAGLTAVQDAVKNTQPTLFTDPGSQTTAVVFLTRFLEAPPTQSQNAEAIVTYTLAASKNVVVYVLQTDFSAQRKDPLIQLATGAHGTYNLLKGSTVQTTMGQVFTDINSQRAAYEVKYRSTKGDPGQRTITVNSAQKTPNGTTGSYEVTPTKPGVSISQPGGNATITRTAQLSADGTRQVFDVNTQAVIADVSWTDPPRNVKSVELLANGVSQKKLEPGPGETHFEFNWDMTDLTTAGSTPVKLEVTVTDELGLVNTADVTVNVKVIPLAPTPTPTKVSVIDKCVQDPEACATPYWPAIVGLVCLGILVLVPISFLIFYLTRPTQARQVVRDIQNTLIGGAPLKAKSLATVTVVEGPKGLIGEGIAITKAITTLGRNPKMADIVFYPDVESSVSRLHATIQLDGKVFKLTDNNSTSGTRLNGRRLSPNDPADITDGDEIVLGDLGRLGVKLRFGFLMDKTQLPASGTASDKTFIMDDYDKDDWDKYKDH